jgi:hypothetical protein
MKMKLFTAFCTACLISVGVATADAQDRFVYRPHFGAHQSVREQIPWQIPQDRFVHRPNYGAVRHGVGTRTPNYAEYYLRRHNQLPPYGGYDMPDSAPIIYQR